MPSIHRARGWREGYEFSDLGISSREVQALLQELRAPVPLLLELRGWEGKTQENRNVHR